MARVYSVAKQFIGTAFFVLAMILAGMAVVQGSGFSGGASTASSATQQGLISGFNLQWLSATTCRVEPGICSAGTLGASGLGFGAVPGASTNYSGTQITFSTGQTIDITAVANGTTFGLNSFTSATTISTTNAAATSTTAATIVAELGAALVKIDGTQVTFTTVTTTMTTSADVRGVVAIGDLVGSDAANTGFSRVTAINAAGTSVTLVAAIVGGDVGGATNLKKIELPVIKAANAGSDIRLLNTLTAAGTAQVVNSNWGSASTTVALTIGVRPGSTAGGPWFLAVWASSGATGTTVFASTQRTTPYIGGSGSVPSGYATAYRRIGWLPIDIATTGQLVAFEQYGSGPERRYYYERAKADTNFNTRVLTNGTANATWTAVLANVVLPPATTRFMVSTIATPAANGLTAIYERARGAGDSTASRPGICYGTNATGPGVTITEVPCDPSGAFDYTNDSANGGTYLDVSGFADSP